jgi:hypothetical protein
MDYLRSLTLPQPANHQQRMANRQPPTASHLLRMVNRLLLTVSHRLRMGNHQYNMLSLHHPSVPLNHHSHLV